MPCTDTLDQELQLSHQHIFQAPHLPEINLLSFSQLSSGPGSFLSLVLTSIAVQDPLTF